MTIQIKSSEDSVVFGVCLLSLWYKYFTNVIGRVINWFDQLERVAISS